MTAIGLPLRERSARGVAEDFRRWARENLFNSRTNAVITVVLLFGVAWFAYTTLRWVFTVADWEVVRTNRRLLLVGRFPVGEEWRIWPAMYGFVVAIAWSWGAWGRVSRVALFTILLVAALVLPILSGTGGLRHVAAATLLAVACYWAARWLVARPRHRARARWASIVAWGLVLPAALVLLRIQGGVDPALWGGLYLNIIVASGAVIGALPLGFALALGRTSSFRALKVTSTVYIELMRGLPLPVMLTLSWLALRTFLPSWGGLDEVPLVYRVTIAFALFTAAFIAEAIRGGLNAIPRGQREASQALGLSWRQGMVYVTLPQAVRNSLPAVAGELIGLFMSTTLVAVVGLTDTLQAARATTEQPAFFGRQKEVLLFVGLLFWVTAFALSRLSSRLERVLAGTGRRRI